MREKIYYCKLQEWDYTTNKLEVMIIHKGKKKYLNITPSQKSALNRLVAYISKADI